MSSPSNPFGASWRAQVATEIRNRLRSPASLVAFFAILVGSYWAIPPAEGKATTVSWQLADGRVQAPELSAPYLGVAIAVLMAIFFLIVAFYLVVGSVTRDRERGIGLLLAASPLTKRSYLGAKLVANTLYLAALSLLAVPVGLFHFLRNGTGAFQLVPFLAPALLLVLPAAVFLSAAALLFDVTPGLRSKGGLVLWFLIGLPLLSVLPIGMSRDTMDGPMTRLPIYDPLGLVTNQYLLQASLPAGSRGVSTGYILHNEPPERVPWQGSTVSAQAVGLRALNLLWALPLFLGAVLIFDRFDPARRSGRGPRRAVPSESTAGTKTGPVSAPARARALSSLAPITVRPRVVAAVWAETRLLWDSAHWLKWLVPPIALAAALVPSPAVPMVSSVFLLLLVPIVSEAGCREKLAGAGPLVFSQPAVPGSIVLWKFAAVALFLLAVGLPLTVRGALSGSTQAVAVPLGMVFVAAFAVGSAALSGGGKLFSAVYLLLWYLGLNQLAEADFCAVLAPTAPWSPRLGFTLAGLLWLAAAVGAERKRRSA